MKPETPRARRRHARWRMVRKALRLYRMFDSGKNSPVDDRGLCVKRRPFDPERGADNLQRCSCYLCGNRRDIEGPPLRERPIPEDTIP